MKKNLLYLSLFSRRGVSLRFSERKPIFDSSRLASHEMIKISRLFGRSERLMVHKTQITKSEAKRIAPIFHIFSTRLSSAASASDWLGRPRSELLHWVSGAALNTACFINLFSGSILKSLKYKLKTFLSPVTAQTRRSRI